jgi:hypothetical protein
MILVDAKSDECLEAITIVCQHIIRGTYTGQVREALISTRLVAVAKGDHDVRPVAIEEPLLKMATILARNSIKDDVLRRLFEPLQLGAHSRAGTERAIHALQLRLERAFEDGVADIAAAKVDAINAYNTIDRFKVASSLISNELLAKLWSLFELQYARPGPLLVYQDGALIAVLESRQGVRQGDPMSSLLFALTIQPLLEELASSFPSANFTAIQDDLTVLFPGEIGPAVFERITSGLAQLGIGLKAEKKKAVVLRPSLRTSSWLADEGFEVLQDGLLPMLGGAVCIPSDPGDPSDPPQPSHSTKLSRWVALRVQTMESSIKAACSLLLPLYAVTWLLRLCVIPKAAHFARLFPPEVACRPLKKWDHTVLSRFLNRANLSASDFAKERFALPLGMGGLGFRRLAATASEAYFSSMLAAPIELGKIVPDVASSALPAIVALRSCHDSLVGLRTPEDKCLGASFSQTWDMHSACASTRLQHHLSSRRHRHQLESMRTDRDASHEEIAALTSATQEGASLFLTSAPTCGKNCPPDDVLRAQYQVYFVLPALPRDSASSSFRCNCGVEVEEKLASGKVVGSAVPHLMSCQIMPNQPRIGRHDSVKAELARGCRELSLQIAVELPEALWSRRKRSDSKEVRPDITIFGSEPWFVDVAVVNPTAKSRCPSRKIAAAALSAAAVVEARKRQRYGALLAKKPGFSFSPFVVEAHGALGKEAQAFLKWLGQRYERRFGLGKSQFLFRLKVGISLALQRDNAHCLLRALDRCSKASG